MQEFTLDKENELCEAYAKAREAKRSVLSTLGNTQTGFLGFRVYFDSPYYETASPFLSLDQFPETDIAPLIDSHLSACEPCFRSYDLDKTIEFLRRARCRFENKSDLYMRCEDNWIDCYRWEINFYSTEMDYHKERPAECMYREQVHCDLSRYMPATYEEARAAHLQAWEEARRNR